MPNSDERPTSRIAGMAPKELERIYAQILKYASFRVRSREAGRDLAQEVFARALDPDRSNWNPDTHPDLTGYLIGDVDSVLAGQRKKDKLRRSPEVVAAVTTKFHPPVPTPEQTLERRLSHEAYVKLWQHLRKGFESAADPSAPLTLKIMDQYEDGVVDATEQARAVGADIEDVYRARQRIDRRARALRERAEAGQLAHIAASPAAEDDDEVSP